MSKNSRNVNSRLKTVRTPRANLKNHIGTIQIKPCNVQPADSQRNVQVEDGGVIDNLAQVQLEAVRAETKLKTIILITILTLVGIGFLAAILNDMIRGNLSLNTYLTFVLSLLGGRVWGKFTKGG